MKKIYLALAIMLSLFVIPVFAVPVNAARHDITASGNETALNYTTYYISTSQLNSTVAYNEEPYFRAMINVSTNGTASIEAEIEVGATVTGLNFTLGDTWAVNTLTKIYLENSTNNIIMEKANATKADGNYYEAYFNLTDLGEDGKSGTVEITNTTNTTFYIVYRLATIDSKKLLTQSTSGTHYDDRIIYQTPSDLDIENITVTYIPSVFSSIDVFKTVSWNGTTLSKGTSGDAYMQTTTGIQVIGTKTFLNGTNNTFNMTYTTGEASGSHGGTGAGRSRPSTMTYRPTYPSYNPFQAIIEFFRRLFGLR